MTEEYTLYFDGCSKGNPGKAGIGAVIYLNGEEIWSNSEYIGMQTNNVAEYSGLIMGLEHALSLNITDLSIKGDSLLVVSQVNGSYKVNSEKLIPYYKRAKDLLKSFNSFNIKHVYRKDNKRADKLSNDALLM